MNEKLLFRTFEEFCERCEEILDQFEKCLKDPKFNSNQYKDYIYNQHTFSDNKLRDMLAKDRCWMWIMSYKYEKMNKSDLFKIRGRLKKGN